MAEPSRRNRIITADSAAAPRRRGGTRAALLCLFATFSSPMVSAQILPSDPAALRRALASTLRDLQTASGYRLTGRFEYRGAAEVVDYDASYVRRGNRWVVHFRAPDPTWNISFGSSGAAAWASSQEEAVPLEPDALPICARFDCPALLNALADILARGSTDKSFKLGSDGNDFYVRGVIPGGITATYLFQQQSSFPRKVTLKGGSPPIRAWYFVMNHRGAPAVYRFPGAPAGHVELWFSDPDESGNPVYPRRTDYLDTTGIIGTFYLEERRPLEAGVQVPPSPPIPVWGDGPRLRPKGRPADASLFLPGKDLQEFRRRLDTEPWRRWKQVNAWVAFWASAAPWIGMPFSGAPGRALSISVGVAFVAGLLLVFVRRRRYGARVFPPLVVIASVLGLVLLSGTAANQVRAPRGRSLLALHSAIRFSATGNPSYARLVRRYLEDLPDPGSSRSIRELARAAAANAVAYDLCAAAFTAEARAQIERALIGQALPLAGALQGWRAHSADAATVATGLGLTGLVTNSENFVKVARESLDRCLREQFQNGLHRAGPGPSAAALCDAADLFFALKKTGAADYYRDPAVDSAARTLVGVLSPAGTLPLVGATGLDCSIRAATFLQKIASHVPDDLAGQCTAAVERLRKHGYRGSHGFRRWRPESWHEASDFVSDPLVLFEFERRPPAGAMPGASAGYAAGRLTVLRSGSDPSALYLALGALQPDPETPVHDSLGFDLYGAGNLLLHGAGFPSAGSTPALTAGRSENRNTIGVGGRDQVRGGSAAPIETLLNMPLFDYVRLRAGRAYDDADVRRDAILVRPQQGLRGYVVLIDDVLTAQADSKVAWFVHSRGRLSLGIAQNHQWAVPAFNPTSKDAMISVFLPGNPGTPRSVDGRLYFENPGYDARLEGLVVEWMGRRRVFAILIPRLAGEPEPRVEPAAGGESARIYPSDWISLGSPDARRTTGPFSHASEYVIVRERGGGSPSFFMNSGTEFRQKDHSFTATHPVTVSMEGLRGSLLTVWPDTTVEIRSPQLNARMRFELNGRPVEAEDGLIRLTLDEAGLYGLQPASSSR